MTPELLKAADEVVANMKAMATGELFDTLKQCEATVSYAINPTLDLPELLVGCEDVMIPLSKQVAKMYAIKAFTADYNFDVNPLNVVYLHNDSLSWLLNITLASDRIIQNVLRCMVGISILCVQNIMMIIIPHQQLSV